MNPYHVALEYADLPTDPIGIWGQFKAFCVENAARIDANPRHSQKNNPFLAAIDLATGPVDERLRLHLVMLGRHWDNE